MKYYTLNPLDDQCATVRCVAAELGQALEVECVDDDFMKKDDFTKNNQTGNLPMLSTAEGSLQESSAIIKYLCALSGKMLGENDYERSLVDQWFAYVNTTIRPTVNQINTGIFGTGEITLAAFNDANKNLKAQLKVLNTALEKNQFLVGNSVSCADYVVACALKLPFQTVLDAGFRKAPVSKNVAAWGERMYKTTAMRNVFGNIQMCAKALKPVVKEEPKEEKKKAAPAAAPKPAAKPEKKKDNVESLGETPFVLYDFKTFFVNHADKKGAAVDEWYKMNDWSENGWSFWHFHYDIYEGEGDKLHICNNLMAGFMSRAEHTSKYTFARMAVLGEEGSLQIMGLWFVRGQELPDGLVKEHPQMEYYRTRKLDPRNNKEDDELVRSYFGGQEGDTLSGLKCNTLKWHK